MSGVRLVPQTRVLAARALGASPWQIVRLVILPSSLPALFTGLRIALAAAFSTTVASELLAANNGLGWMVIAASHFLRNDVVLLGILILGIVGMALSAILERIERRVVHWRGRG